MPASLSDLRGLTEPALAVASVGLPTREAISFESAFTDVRKTVTATNAELAAMEANLRRMAAGKNPIPISANELAGIAAAAGQLGIATPNIQGFTRVMADLGVATNLTGEQAAAGLAKFGNITDLPQDQFDRLGSTIVALGNNTASTEADILSMSLRIAGAGKQVGLSQAQIMGFGAALSSVGIEAESGGSAISRVFVTIDQAAREGGKKLDIMAQVAGTTAAKFKQAFEKDAAGATVQFIEGLKRVSDGGGNVFAVLEKLSLGELRVRDALLRASNAGDLFSKSLDLGTQAWRDNNALSKEAETRYATTASKLEILQNRAKEAGIEIGEKFLTRVAGMSDKLGDAIGILVPLTNSFLALPEPIQNTVIGFGALLAVIGPAKFVFGGVIANVNSLTGALSALGAAAMANPLLAVAAIAAAVGGYVLLKGVFEKITDAQSKAADGAVKMHDALSGAVEALPEGNKYGARIKAIRDEIDAAGTDVGKLDEATKKLTDAQHDLTLNVKDPDIALVVGHDLAEAQKLLDQQKLHAEVIVTPIYEQAQRAITDGWMTTAGRPVWDLGSGTNSVVDWLTSDGDDGSALDRSRLRFSGEGRQIEAALNAGSAETKRKREAARRAQSGQSAAWRSSLFPEPTAPYVLPSDRYAPPPSTTKDGKAIFTAPGVKPTTTAPTESERVEAARARVAAKKTNAASAPPAPPTPVNIDLGEDEKASKARAKADREREKAERERERLQQLQEAARQRALERARGATAGRLEDEARQFDSINGIVAGLTDQIAQTGGATEAARLQAKLLADEFAAIPAHLKAGAVQLAAIAAENEKLVAQRDGLRSSNAEVLKQLIRAGADTSGFIAGVRGQERAYGFGPRLAANTAQATRISQGIESEASAASRGRQDRATYLRDQNALEDPRSVRGGYAPSPRTKVTGDTIVDIVKAVHAGKQPAFRQTCAWAVSRIYDELGVELKTQNNNWAANLVKYARAHWRQVDAATAPPGALLAEPSKSANSGWHVTVSRGGRNRAGSNVHKPQYGTAGKNAMAFVPPELEVGAAPRAAAPAPKPSTNHSKGPMPVLVRADGSLAEVDAPVAATPTKSAPKKAKAPKNGGAPKLPPPVAPNATWQGEQGRLLQVLPTMLRGWGDLLSDGPQKPGDSRQFRLSKQDELLGRLAGGEKISEAQLASERAAANKADVAISWKKATDDAARATREFSRDEATKTRILSEARAKMDEAGGSTAAYERATFESQTRIKTWNSEQVVALYNQKRFADANREASAQIKAAMDAYDADKAAREQLELARAAREAALETKVLNEQRTYLGENAGKAEATIARELKLIEFRLREIDRWRDSGKTQEEAEALANEATARRRVSDALGEQISYMQTLNAERKKARDERGDLDKEGEMIDQGVSRGDREREMARRAAIRDKEPGVQAAIERGEMTEAEGDVSLWNVGEDAVSAFDRRARNRAKENRNGTVEDARARVATLQAQIGNVKAAPALAGDPAARELEIVNALLEKRQELEAFNREATTAEKIDVDEMVNLYEDELRAQDELNRVQEQRRGNIEAQNSLLDAQKAIELSLARTASERLEIEQRYSNEMRRRAGAPVTPQEEQAQADQRVAVDQNERLGAVRAQIEGIRDLMATSLDDGSKDGMSAMARNFAQGLAQMVKQAAFRRLANAGVKSVFGVDLEAKTEEGGGGDFLDLLSRKKTAPFTPLLNAAGTQSRQQARGDLQLPAIADAPPATGLAGVLQRVLGKTEGEGNTLSSAVFNIANANQTIGVATINATRTNGATQTGAGSGPSTEQMALQALQIFGV